MDKGIIMTIYRNLKPYEGKKVSISSSTSLKKLLTICSEILSPKTLITLFILKLTHRHSSKKNLQIRRCRS